VEAWTTTGQRARQLPPSSVLFSPHHHHHTRPIRPSLVPPFSLLTLRVRRSLAELWNPNHSAADTPSIPNPLCNHSSSCYSLPSSSHRRRPARKSRQAAGPRHAGGSTSPTRSGWRSPAGRRADRRPSSSNATAAAFS